MEKIKFYINLIDLVVILFVRNSISLYEWLWVMGYLLFLFFLFEGKSKVSIGRRISLCEERVS